VGACMVIYRGLTDDDHSAMAGQRVEQEASYEIGILARTLREHQPPQGAGTGTGTGAYDLLDTCRKALMGWRVPVASGVTRVQKDAFDDYIEGVWGYTIRLTVPLLTVIDIAEPDEPWMVGESAINSMGFVGAGERLGENTLPVPNADSAFTPFTAPTPPPRGYP
jgi:Gp37 protein